MVDEATARAREVLRRNYYMVLGTVDDEGPWTAAVAYTPRPPNRLYFTSRTWSRHARALAADPRVAGVIFDSRAKTDVECIQFTGTCAAVVDAAEVRTTLQAGTEVVGHAEGVDDDDVRAITADPDLSMYRIEVGAAFVLDQEAYAERGVDARQPVSFERTMRALWA